MEEPEKTRAIRNEKGQFVPDASGDPDGQTPGAVSIVAPV
jgi:hypothetical protein